MYPQHVATQTSFQSPFDAAESQGAFAISVSYLLHRFSRIFPQGYTQVTLPQEAGLARLLAGAKCVERRYRRQKCLRASKAFSQCPCLPSWQHVARTLQATWKNSWSWTPFPSPLSQCSPANTTKVVLTNPGQASAPVPHRHSLPRKAR